MKVVTLKSKKFTNQNRTPEEGWGGGGRAVLGLIFAGYVPLAS